MMKFASHGPSYKPWIGLYTCEELLALLMHRGRHMQSFWNHTWCNLFQRRLRVLEKRIYPRTCQNIHRNISKHLCSRRPCSDRNQHRVWNYTAASFISMRALWEPWPKICTWLSFCCSRRLYRKMDTPSVMSSIGFPNVEAQCSGSDHHHVDSAWLLLISS